MTRSWTNRAMLRPASIQCKHASPGNDRLVLGVRSYRMKQASGVFRARRMSIAGLVAAILTATGGDARAAGTDQESNIFEQPTPPPEKWSFAGPWGFYDQAQLQRGFQVYREICSNCHSLKLLAFRNLADPGGPRFSEKQVKALAATYKIKDGPNDSGEMFERPGRPSDYLPWNFANEQAARAAPGAVPPDMSLLAKARSYERGFPYFLIDFSTQYQEQGPDYIYALLNGYTKNDDPAWNKYFPGHKIAMPKPLADGVVDYADGSPKTLPQYAKD